MSGTKQDIKAAFDEFQVLPDQKNKFTALDEGADVVIDKLNEFLETATEDIDKEKAQEAITALMNVKDDEIAMLKTLQAEARGKGANKSKDRVYDRQVSSAIDAVRSAIAYFL